MSLDICPICKDKNPLMIGLAKVGVKASKIIHNTHTVVKCKYCDTYFVSPFIDLTPEGWKFLYDENYFPQMSKWYEKSRARDRKERFDKLALFFDKTVNNFLDVGCGEGHCLVEAEKRGWKSHGVDISDHRIEMAKNNTIQFKNSTLTQSNYPDNHFDIIYLDSVLEHVLNPLDYLHEIRRILKKGGLLYIGVPNEDSLLNDFKKVFYWISRNKVAAKLKPFETPYHVVGFNEKSIKFALSLAHFDIREIRNFACRYEFMRAKPFSKAFFHALALFPIYILAILFRKEVYLEVYAQK